MKFIKKIKTGLVFILLPWKAEKQRARFLGMALLFLLIIIAGLGFTSVLHYTATTEFCLKCHEMTYTYKWYKNSKHGSNDKGISVDCKDCHLPENPVRYMMAKAQALKELYVHFFHPIKTEEEWLAKKEDMDESARSKIRNSNCIKCHNNYIDTKRGKEEHAEMDPKEDKCVECHAEMFHVVP